MTNQSETIAYDQAGFDGEKYIQLQYTQIKERMSQFTGRLYLEIGGKFMFDAHASRVFPGFQADSKKTIFSRLAMQAEVVFCVNTHDIITNRQLSNEPISYEKYVIAMLADISEQMSLIPKVVFTMIDAYAYDNNLADPIHRFRKTLEGLGYQVYKKFLIEGYPAVDNVVSKQGYGQDDHIPLTQNLVLVTGAASNSGKLSTCLGQIYLDKQKDIKSGYAKYETFPVWNLPLDHPVNLAYEAATADIGDVNCLDTYHQKEYGQTSVNYNRDIEAFALIMTIAKHVVNHKNYMRKYKSPTDMGISTAGFAITNDAIVCQAATQEIQRRKERYQQMVDRGAGEKLRVKRCDKLLSKAKSYKK